MTSNGLLVYTFVYGINRDKRDLGILHCVQLLLTVWTCKTWFSWMTHLIMTLRHTFSGVLTPCQFKRIELIKNKVPFCLIFTLVSATFSLLPFVGEWKPFVARNKDVVLFFFSKNNDKRSLCQKLHGQYFAQKQNKNKQKQQQKQKQQSKK